MMIFAFDLDGTLVKWKNSWDEIRKKYGLSSLYYEYLRGNITFYEMKRKEAEAWRRAGVDREGIEEVVEEMKYNTGAEEIIGELKEFGKVGIISAAPDLMVRKAAEDLEVDFWCSSRILFDSSGRVKGFLLLMAMPEDKAERLEYYCYRYSVSLSNSVAVGDSEIDKKMLEKAGLGIAFNPEDHVKEVADVIVEGEDLRKIKKVLEEKIFGKTRFCN